MIYYKCCGKKKIVYLDGQRGKISQLKATYDNQIGLEGLSVLYNG